MNILNTGLYNFLFDISEQPRWACYYKDGLIVHIGGDNKIIYKNGIVSFSSNYDGSSTINDVDKSLLDAIIEKLTTTTVEKLTHKEELKQKYKIDKKTLRPKDLETIAKYEETMRRNRK